MQLNSKKSVYLVLLLLLCAPRVHARRDRPDLAVKNINPELKNEFTHSILRSDSAYLEILNLDEVRYTHIFTVTILDKTGSAAGNLIVGYSKSSKIDDISGTFYDAQGNYLKHINAKDAADLLQNSQDEVFYTDSRAKVYLYASNAYPYTVVYKITKTINNTLFLPDWNPQTNAGVSVNQSVFVLNYPKSLKINRKVYNMPQDLTKSVKFDDSKNRYTVKWRLNHLISYEPQPYSDTGSYTTPALLLTANHFDLMGHKGQYDSWKSFGHFFYSLNKGRDSLNPEMVAKVKTMVQGDTSVLQKVQTLYHYMQQNTRYVANEYGLAGWQTFPASEVCQKGYGDCKGLSNYLKALLKAANIPSCLVLARAGKNANNKVDPTFPSSYFNHVILCVPNKQDSIWVECTSPVLKAGYLGGFTGNRYVLVCGPQGGKLVKTPTYGIHKSFIHRTTHFSLNPNSDKQTVFLNDYYSGLFQDALDWMIKEAGKKMFQKAINHKFNFPSYKVENYHYTFAGTPFLPAIREKIKADVSGIVSKSGSRYFVKMGWMANPMKEIVQTIPRTKPIVFEHSCTISDSVQLTIPPNYTVEFMPSKVDLEYPFATFKSSYIRNHNTVTLVRTYTQHKGNYSARYFKDYEALFQKMKPENANNEIVLVASSK